MMDLDKLSESKKIAASLYQSGFGFRKISQKTGLSTTTIRRHVIKLGIHRANNYCGGQSKGHQEFYDKLKTQTNPMKFLKPAVFSELKSFKKGDERTHWNNHPEAIKWQARRYYWRNPEECKARAMAYQRSERGRAARKEYNARPETRERMKTWRAKPENKAKQSAYIKDYKKRDHVRDKLRDYQRRREKESRQAKDNLYHASKWRRRLRDWFKTGYPKYFNEIAGCSLSDFRDHIASQFDDDMCFENYGAVWEFDHVIPCCAFDLSKMNEVKLCFGYDNTRPIRPLDNSKKSAMDLKLKKWLGRHD